MAGKEEDQVSITVYEVVEERQRQSSTCQDLGINQISAMTSEESLLALVTEARAQWFKPWWRMEMHLLLCKNAPGLIRWLWVFRQPDSYSSLHLLILTSIVKATLSPKTAAEALAIASVPHRKPEERWNEQNVLRYLLICHWLEFGDKPDLCYDPFIKRTLLAAKEVGKYSLLLIEITTLNKFNVLILRKKEGMEIECVTISLSHTIDPEFMKRSLSKDLFFITLY